MDGAAHAALLPEPGGDAVAQGVQRDFNVVVALQVPRGGGAVADGLDRRDGIIGGDPGAVLPVGKLPEHHADLAQERVEKLQAGLRKLADGVYPVPAQLAGGGRTDVEQVGDRQRPHHGAVILPCDEGGGVGLLIVAAQLGEDLVEGYPHRSGKAQLPPNPGADVVRDGLARSEEPGAAAHVQPALVQPEGLHAVGIGDIDVPDRRGELQVAVVAGRDDHEVPAPLAGLPDGLPGLHAAPLGLLGLGQDNAVPRRGIAADRHRPAAQLRIVPALR